MIVILLVANQTVIYYTAELRGSDKGAQDPGLRITILVQFCKLSSHWRMNFKSKRDLSCMLSETSISHVDVMNVLDILTLIDSRLCSDFSTATSVYFGVESSKLGQAVSGNLISKVSYQLVKVITFHQAQSAAYNFPFN